MSSSCIKIQLRRASSPIASALGGACSRRLSDIDSGRESPEYCAQSSDKRTLSLDEIAFRDRPFEGLARPSP